MTPEEIAASDDVDELWTQLRAAKAFGDDATVRAIEARMRELSEATSRTDRRSGRVAVDDAAAERVNIRARWSGGGHF